MAKCKLKASSVLRKLMTVRQAAAYLKCSAEQVYKLIEAGTLPVHHRVFQGEYPRFLRTDVESISRVPNV